VTTPKLADKYVEETIRACDTLLLTWKTHGSPLGDRKVKETMYRVVSTLLEEIEQWRENSSTGDTLNCLTSIKTFLEEIKKMNSVVVRRDDITTTSPAKKLREEILDRVEEGWLEEEPWLWFTLPL